MLLFTNFLNDPDDPPYFKFANFLHDSDNPPVNIF